MHSAAAEPEPACPRDGCAEVTVEPSWDQWASALSSHTPNPARRQLGLPNERPIVFSGHQPVVYHNGILAKLIAQHEAAKRTGAARVWIVADQDPLELESLRVPVGQGKSLRHDLIQLLTPGATPPGVPSAALPAMDPLEIEDERLHELVSYLQGYTHEASLGRQFASATIQLACDHLAIEAPQLIYASELCASDTLWAIIERILEDPHACVRAYNSAAERYPDARVRLLRIDEDRVELPLWGLREGFSRVAIDTKNVVDFERTHIAPRGLLMSLLVRAHLGELFIHGTGGWSYDRITQDWARDWLGLELAPMALATATQRLELGFAENEVIDLDQASWTHHHARHTPGLLGDEQAQARKDELVASIESQKQRGHDPEADYQRMVALLEDYRQRHRGELDAMHQRIAHAKANQKQIELANERTWPFVLFDDPQLGTLRDAVVGALR